MTRKLTKAARRSNAAELDQHQLGREEKTPNPYQDWEHLLEAARTSGPVPIPAWACRGVDVDTRDERVQPVPLALGLPTKSPVYVRFSERRRRMCEEQRFRGPGRVWSNDEVANALTHAIAAMG